MAFHDIRFPTSLSFGALGGPERRTEIVTLANGFEERNSPWSQSRRRYDAGPGPALARRPARGAVLLRGADGPAHAFRWKDWADFQSGKPSATPSPTDQRLGTGDGATRAFQLRKGYASGGVTAWRTITKPLAGTVRIAVAGEERTTGWTLDASTGLLSFAAAPAAGAPVTAGFEFDVPVRFDTDAIRVQVSTFQAGEVPSIPVIEVRA
jgi:uncharacterized protein (TIGR02217 family)